MKNLSEFINEALDIRDLKTVRQKIAYAEEVSLNPTITDPAEVISYISEVIPEITHCPDSEMDAFWIEDNCLYWDDSAEPMIEFIDGKDDEAYKAYNCIPVIVANMNYKIDPSYQIDFARDWEKYCSKKYYPNY